MRTRLSLLTLLAVFGLSAAAATSAFGRGTAVTTLKGTVGPGFTISLKQGSKPVKTLKAGTYKFVVSDRSANHNFVLERESGTRFERKITSVSFTGTRSMTVKLTAGAWKVYCEPHSSMMVARFGVGRSAPVAGLTTTGDDHGGHGGHGSDDGPGHG
ncbi:MAG: hypothetical protein QOG81_1306 [Gaiellaceae bacterium]|nr:hypothetical protein [Gaiellaceae bacterium]